MVQEHHRLADLIAAAYRALVSPDAVPRPMFADLGGALRDHLDHEERTVLPLLEQHLSRAEWHRFLVTEKKSHPTSRAAAVARLGALCPGDLT